MTARPASIQAVILAGGLGTRMRPHTGKVPKSLLKVGGRPFIEHQIELLKKSGILELVLCVHHRAGSIRSHCGNGGRLGIRISYSEEKERPLGTAGALKNAAPLLKDTFMVIYGDSYLPLDYEEIIEHFRGQERLALMTVYENFNRYDSSNVRIGNGMVLKYAKDNPRGNLSYIEFGLNIFRLEVLELIPAGQSYSLGQLYQELIEKGELAAYKTRQRFYEIGSSGGLRDLEEYLASQGDHRDTSSQ